MSLELFAGIKLPTLIAGFVGGVVSLAYVPGLTLWKAGLAVLTGAAAAAYLTPIVVDYAALSTSWEHGVAFLSGLMGMNVLAGLFRLSERFRESPGETLKLLRRGK